MPNDVDWNCVKEAVCCSVQEGNTVEVKRMGTRTTTGDSPIYDRAMTSVWTGKAVTQRIKPKKGGYYSSLAENNRHNVTCHMIEFTFCPDDVAIFEKDDIIAYQGEDYEVLVAYEEMANDIVIAVIAVGVKLEKT